MQTHETPADVPGMIPPIKEIRASLSRSIRDTNILRRLLKVAESAETEFAQDVERPGEDGQK